MITQLKFLRKLFIFHGSFAFALWLWLCTAASASVIDAPHNEISNIYCTSCHAYSLWWQYSPAQKQANFVSLVDTICLDCHGERGNGPTVLTHSSTNIGSTLHGTWERACTACHNPHYQDQLKWANTTPSPYLATATITAVAYDPDSKQTTITYSDAISSPNWPAEGATQSDFDWANKSLANPGRGLILVQDTVKTSTTYSIVTADATTVTVKGELNANMIDPNYTDPVTLTKNSATCNTFGLIYGDLIRDTVNSRSVKFFDPNGGFVSEGGTAATGICQVCHDSTQHYSLSGELPSGSDTHVGRDGMNCINCHKHITGFKGEGHDESSFSWGGNCATCHNPTGAQINITTAIHGGKCDLCHVNPAGGGPRKDGDPANGVDGSAVDGTNSSTCVDCHLNKLSLTGGAIHHVSAHGYAADGNCTRCHDNVPGKLAADHSAAVTLAPDCSSCHAVTAGTATGMPVSSSDNKLHDGCTTCHETNGSLKAPYGKAIAMPATGGSCTDCHGAYFASHQNINHSSRVAGTTNCTTCHTATAGTATGIPVDPLNNKVHDACATCHEANGALKTPYGKATAMPAGGGDCNACHGAYFINHINANHVTRVATSANCSTCHSATAGSTTTVPVNPDDNKIHDACVTCHNPTTGARLAPYGKAVAIPAGGGTCDTCHGAYFPNHVNANHTTRVAATTNCTTCHTGTAGMATGMPVSASDNKVHDACATCHNLDGSLRAANIYSKAPFMPAGGGDCNACHGAYFTKHLNPNHATHVAGTTNCTSCHTATAGTSTGIPVDPANNKVHDACNTCHDVVNGALNAPYGKAVAMPAGGGDCNACHGAYFINHANANHITRVATSPNCNTCHTDTAGTMTTVPISLTDNKVHDACATCHDTTTGARLAPYGKAIAIPAGGGTCDTCHGAYFPNHVAPNHATRVTASPDCVSCHMATAGSATGIPVSTSDNRVHDGCSTCHNEANGSLRAQYSSRTVAMQAGSCVGCHGDYFLNHDNLKNTTTSTHTFLTRTTPSCLTCHDQAGNADIVANIHKNTCGKCHDESLNADFPHAMINGTKVAQTYLGVDYMIGDARHHTYGTTSSCRVCHLYNNKVIGWEEIHPTADRTHVANVGDEALCLQCHVALKSPYVASLGDSNSLHVEVHSGLTCGTCHDAITGWVLKGSALNHTVGQPSSCSTCHIGYDGLSHTSQTNPCVTCHYPPPQ